MGVTIGIVTIGVLLVAAILSPRKLLVWWALGFAVVSAVAMLWAASLGLWLWAGLAALPLVFATYEFVHEVRLTRVRTL